MMIPRVIISAFLCVSYTLTISTFAEEAIVDFQEKRLVENTTSLALIGEESLYDKASESLEEVLAQVPNVNFSSLASRAHYIQIRGIGEHGQVASVMNPSIGIMMDGIDFSHSSLGVTLFDTKKIEVLKGPQGTTFGATRMAGVINIQSNEPTEELEGHIESTIGNYNTQAYGLALSASLLEDVLEARLSLYQYRSDGYMSNSFLAKDDTQNIDELTAKLQLRWYVSDNHTIDFNFRHVDIDNGYDAFTLDNSRDSHADQIGTDAQKTNAFAIKSKYQIDDALYLISTFTHSQSDIRYAYDEDWSFIGEFDDSFTPYSAFDAYNRESIQSDIDMKLVSDRKGRIFADSTDWTIGMYYKNYAEDLLREYSYFETAFKSEYKTSSQAIYGQLDTVINEKITMVSGLRIEVWDADYSDSDEVILSTDEVLVGGKFGFNYEENTNKMYYAYLSKGYQLGGINADNTSFPEAKFYRTENLWNIEVGMNSSHLEDRLINRLNIFYGKRDEQRVESSVVIAREDGSKNFVGYITNVAKSNYYGLESQLDWYPNERIHIYSSIGLLQATFDEYNLKGRTPAYCPKYQYNLGFDMTFWDGWIWKSNIEGKGLYYFSNRHNEKSEAYTLLHSSIEYTIGSWSVVAWMRNIADTQYETRGFGSFGNNPSKGYEIERYTQKGTPRTGGLTLSYDF